MKLQLTGAPTRCRSPTITSVTATSPTTAVLSAAAPGGGGLFSLFTLTATPVGGGAAVSVSCALPADCALTGLKAGVTYDVSVVATGAGGALTPPSAPLTLVMPPPAAPTLTAADAAGPTQGTASAAAPASGGPWDSYVFTATPLGGGSAVAVTSATPSATFNGLLPGTQYSVGVVAKGSGGSSPPSNKLSLVTPSLK